MRPGPQPHAVTPPPSRLDRLALRIASRQPAATTPRAHTTSAQAVNLSRRSALARALAALAFFALPMRLANPTSARADSYCAAACLDAATSAGVARATSCSLKAFGVDFPDAKAAAQYVSSKIKSGGLGALVVINELTSFDRCFVITEVRYHYEAGRCGEPNCGNPKKYPRPIKCGPESSCAPNFHCCVCKQPPAQGEPNPVLLSNVQPCSEYCNIATPDNVLKDTRC
jgi:hypothetical protein